MSEKKLFGGTYKFKNQYMMGIQLQEPGTRIHVKVDSGPRVDRYEVKLSIGKVPSDQLVTNQLDGKTAFHTIMNNGQAIDVTWSIAAVGWYVLTMYHPLDAHRPELVVETTLNVFADKAAMISTVHP